MCFYYAFRFGQAEARSAEFYRYMLFCLSSEFGLSLDVPDNWEALRSTFFDHIAQLERSGSINHQRKLIIIVDAVDEMDQTTQIGNDDGNPLGWPANLPANVHIAFSKRRKGNERSRRLPFSKALTTVFLDPADPESEAFSKHMDTAVRYVRRVCDANAFVLPYHRTSQDAGEEQIKGEFIKRMCEETGYNFMILRSVLNDPEYWSSEASQRPLPHDLTAYNEDLFERLITGEKDDTLAADLQKYMLLCFSLRTRFSNFVLLRLVGGGLIASQSEDKRSRARMILDQWIKQGLVLRERDKDDPGIHWLSIYHETFRATLQARLKEEDRFDFADRFAFNLAEGGTADGGYTYLGTLPPKIIEDWAALTLALLIRLELLHLLRPILLDEEFWLACSKSETGLASGIEPLKRVSPSKGNLEDFDELFREAAALLVKRVSDGCVKTHRSLKSSSIGDLYQMALGVDRTMGQGSRALRFPRYLIPEPKTRQRRLKKDENQIGRIKEQLAQMKSLARDLNTSGALKLAASIEKALTTSPDPEQESTLFYQRGMLFHDLGQYPQSIADLRRSADVAHAGGYLLKGLFSEYRHDLGRFLARFEGLEETYSQLSETFQSTREEIDANGTSALAENLTYNCSVSLCHLAFECNSHLFDQRMQTFLEHRFSTASLEQPNSIYEFYRYQVFARKCFLEVDYERAAGIFALLLGLDFIPVDNEGGRLIPTELVGDVHGASKVLLEIGRDYRDLARALMQCRQLGDRKLELAELVWEQGLSMPDVKGHGFFLEQMRTDRSNAQQN